MTFATLCFRVLFSISDINVEYSYYNQNQIDETNDLLKRYKGSNLFFLKEREIRDLIHNNTSLKVESITKDYPNVLNVKLKERQEMFAIKIDDSFYILDDEYTIVGIRDNIANSIDGLDNIILEFNHKEYDKSLLTVRSTLNIGNQAVMNSFMAMVENISSPRDIVSKIVIEEKQAGENYYFYVETLEGCKIEIRKATELTAEKTKQAITKFLALDDSDRLNGKVASFAQDNGEIVAIYTR